MSALLPLLYVLGLAAWVWCSRPKKGEILPPTMFWAAFALKLVAGLASYYFHFHVLQSGDWWKYREKAQLLTDRAHWDTAEYLRILLFDRAADRSLRRAITIWYNPSFFFVVKSLSLQNLLTNSSMLLNSLAYTVFGFLGSWRLASVISAKWPELKWPILASLFLVPSVVFWSSGLSKEALLVGCLGFVLAYLLRFRQLSVQGKMLGLLGVAVCLYIGWQVRYFVLVALGICLGAAWLQLALTRLLELKSITARALLFLGLFAGVTMLGASLHRNFTISRLLQLTAENQAFVLRRSSAEAAVALEMEPTVPSLLQNSGKALVAALYRPFVWEAKNALLLIASLENLVLVFFTLAAVYVQRYNTSTTVKPELKLALLAYVVVMAVLIGLNTPNFGSLFRYKTMFVPVLVFVLMSGGGWQHFLHGLRHKMPFRK